MFEASHNSFPSPCLQQQRGEMNTDKMWLFFLLSVISGSLLSYWEVKGLKAKGMLNYFPVDFLAFSVLYFEVGFGEQEDCSTAFGILLPEERWL